MATYSYSRANPSSGLAAREHALNVKNSLAKKAKAAAQAKAVAAKKAAAAKAAPVAAKPAPKPAASGPTTMKPM